MKGASFAKKNHLCLNWAYISWRKLDLKDMGLRMVLKDRLGRYLVGLNVNRRVIVLVI
jgi:hypothetical protein